MPKAKHYKSVYGAIRKALAGSIKFTRIVRNVAVMFGTVRDNIFLTIEIGAHLVPFLYSFC